MAEILRQPEMIEQPDGTFVPSRRPPTSTGGRPLPDTPVTEEPLPDTENDSGYNPPDRGDRDPQTNTGSNTQDSVTNDSTKDKLSTDLSTVFGAYGDIFSDILNQLKDLFGSGRDLPDNVNNPINWGSSSSAFTDFLNVISSITDKMSASEAANVTSAVSQMMSYYMQMLSSAVQNQFNIEQWQITNDYNSPKNQLKRLSEAGLNPLHYFDSSSSSASTVTASSGSGPSSFQGQGDPNDFQRAMEGINTVVNGIGTISNVATAGSQVAMQAAKLPSEIAKNTQEVATSQAQAGVYQTQAALNEQKRISMAQTSAFDKALFPSQLTSAYNELRLQEQQFSLNDEALATNRANRASIMQGMAIAAGEFLRENKLADTAIQEAQTRMSVNRGQLKDLLASVRQRNSFSEYQEYQTKFAKETGMPFGTPVADVLACKVANGEDPNALVDTLDKIFSISAAKSGDYKNHAAGTAKYNLQRRSKQFQEDVIPSVLGFFRDYYSFDNSAFGTYKDTWQQMDTSTNNLVRKHLDKVKSFDQNF